MGVGGELRILEVIHVGRIAVLLVAEIDPGVGELMREQRPSADEDPLVVVDFGPQPGIPAIGGYGMARRSDCEQIKNGGFAVACSSALSEIRIRADAHGKQQRTSGQHPAEIDAIEDLMGEKLNFAIRGKIAGRGQYAAEQQPGIDAREFRA